MSPRAVELAIYCHILRGMLKQAEQLRRDCVLDGRGSLIDAATEALAKATRNYNSACEALYQCVLAEGGVLSIEVLDHRNGEPYSEVSR